MDRSTHMVRAVRIGLVSLFAVTSCSGDVGPTGPMGAVGAEGPTGPMGVVGAEGPRGVAGYEVVLQSSTVPAGGPLTILNCGFTRRL